MRHFSMSGFDRKNSLRAVFFDLDGTLLQVEMKEFIPAYVHGLASHFDDFADQRRFADTVLAATFALIRDEAGRENGLETNEKLFLQAMERHLGIEAELFRHRLAAFVDDGLQKLKPMIHPLPLARAILDICFERGLIVVIATNPVFPRPVVEARLCWGELQGYSYPLITTYENTRFCKPHSGYFRDILDHFDLDPRECLMVGNDTEHDLAAAQLGIPTFLVDTWMIDRLGGAFRADLRGDHMALLTFLENEARKV